MENEMLLKAPVCVRVCVCVHVCVCVQEEVAAAFIFPITACV